VFLDQLRDGGGDLVNISSVAGRTARAQATTVVAVFTEARTPAGFADAAVDEETGTVVWPGGADLAPDTLYERARTGAWPDQDVAA
jgi:hypothetical protein